MTQTTERVDNLSATPSDSQVSPVVGSTPENGRRRSARALKDKIEEDRDRARRKKEADSLIIGDRETEEPVQDSGSQDDRDEKTGQQTRSKNREEPAPTRNIDLEA